MIDISTVTDFWDTCNESFSHVGGNKNTDNYYKYLNEVLDLYCIDWKDKTIIDYGIGNGQLYLLFNERGAGKYVGIDLSQRSLDKSREFISRINSKMPYELAITPQDFGAFNADIFITLSVIQHFPNEPYCVEFLQNLNQSNIPKLLLQIRYGDKVRFNDDYSDAGKVAFSSQMNSEFMLQHLTNYNLTFASGINEEKEGWRGRLYQYLHFTLAE